VDTDTVDRECSALEEQAQQTGELIAALSEKLSTAAAGGDPNAREWGLDLKEIALAIRDEQIVTGAGIGIGDDIFNSIFDRL
jgi:hypothetical protein